MRPLDQLINDAESALPFVLELAAAHPGRCVVHPPSPAAGEVLYRTQVTTRSPMGAIAYHTGGITILDGWVRILGSGSPAVPRTLPDWNDGRSQEFYLVADDAFGGFFGLDRGSSGKGPCHLHYFAPNCLRWEPTDLTYTEFLDWSCSDFLGFYDDVTWEGCEQAISKLGPDRCFFFTPPLWTTECVLPPPVLRDVPVEEAWGLQMEMARQLHGAA